MNIAVLFAGGVGTRMKSRELPKQFLVIHGKPVIVRTAELFQRNQQIDEIVIVCVNEWIDYCKSLIDAFSLDKVKRVVAGGNTGQDSIYRGLKAANELTCGEKSIVLIHDGVRPLIKDKTINDNITSVKRYGSAITTVPAKETVVSVSGNGDITSVSDRNFTRLARAPQSFWLDDILKSHQWAQDRDEHNYIDSASLMLARGYKLHTIIGPEENIKVTTPDDFFSVQAILNARENKQIFGLE